MNISPLFSPTTIAVIGASSHPEKVGHQILKNILHGGFRGDVYPINLNEKEILGLEAYTRISDISKKIDLCVIVVPSAHVLNAVNECVQKKVRAIIVISSGFSETGAEGAKLEKEIAEICDKADICLLGPNCLGMLNVSHKLNASFAASFPRPGNISLVSQSGAIISAMIDWSKSSSCGFNKIVSLGNKALLKEADFLDYLYHDNTTEAVMLYLEELRVTEGLTETLIQNSKRKPTVVLFGGKTKAGGTAAKSHTGSLISSYTAVETYLRQAGVIVAEGLEQFFLYGRIFSKLKGISGNSVGIVTNAGGPSIITCDTLATAGFKIGHLGEKTKKSLERELREETNTHNPIDVLGDATPEDFEIALNGLNEDSNIDAIITILTNQTSTDLPGISEALTKIKRKKPTLAMLIGSTSFSQEVKQLEEKGVPVFNFPEETVLALKALYDFCHQKPTLHPVKEVRKTTFKSEYKFEYLNQFNLPVLNYYEARSFEDAEAIAKQLKFPLVAKTGNKEINHKSDSGGVILNIRSFEELEIAFNKLSHHIIIGKMLTGPEIFIGAKTDQSIGTVITFGSGGIYAEIYKDLIARVTPINKEIATSMIESTKIGQILNGARNQKTYNISQLADILVNTGKFIDSFDNISELDFNPLIATREGFYIVDARIITKDKE